jgi:hypothetical protein
MTIGISLPPARKILLRAQVEFTQFGVKLAGRVMASRTVTPCTTISGSRTV